MRSGRTHASRRAVAALFSARRAWPVLAALLLATAALGALSFQAVRREGLVRKTFVVDTHARLADIVSVRLSDALAGADRAIATAISASDRRADALIAALDAIEREKPWLQPLVLVVNERDAASALGDDGVTGGETAAGVAFDALLASAEREELMLENLAAASALYSRAAAESPSARRHLKELNGLARTLLRAEQPARARNVYDRMIESADPLDPQQARWVLVASDQRLQCDAALDDHAARPEHALASFRFATGFRYLVDQDMSAFYVERAASIMDQSQLSSSQRKTWQRLQQRAARLATLERARQGSPDSTRFNAERVAVRVVTPKGASERSAITYLFSGENLQALLATIVGEPGPWSEVGIAVTDVDGRPLASSMQPVPTDRAVAAASLTGAPNWRVAAFPKTGSLDGLAAVDVNRYATWLVLVFGTVVAALLLAARSVSRELTLSRLRSEFVASVSHELKTPLSLIRMFAESLREGWVAEPQKQDYYEVITRESERLTGLINNVLDFTRIESGTRRYQFDVIDLGRLVVELLERYEFHLRAANVELVRELPSGSVQAKVDRDAIEQVIVNLLSNAVKYMGDPARQPRQVRVSLEREDDHVVLRVADTGIGISDEDRLHIFERFYRADDEQVRAVAGSGLGLTLVKAHVEAHRGTIAVDSAPGRGSSFVISLPLTTEVASS